MHITSRALISITCFALCLAGQSPTEPPTSCTTGDLTTGANPDCASADPSWPLYGCVRASVLARVGPSAGGPSAPFSYVSGHTDPATGREFAMISCINGLLVVDAHQVWSPTGPNPVTPQSWFFQDPILAVHRGSVSYDKYIYESSIERGTIRIFRVDVGTGTNPTVNVVDTTLTISIPNPQGYTFMPGAPYRLSVDRERAHLYVPGCCPTDDMGFRPLRIYDISNPTAPCEIAVWRGTGDLMHSFDVHLYRSGSTTRAFVSEYGGSGRLAVLDASTMPTCGSPVDPWLPAWVSWTPSAGAHSTWMTADGDYLYWSWGDAGTTVYDMRAFVDYGINQHLPWNGHNPPPTLAHSYSQVPGRHHMALQGIGYTGYAPSWPEGILLYDLRSGVVNPDQVLGQVDTSACVPGSTLPLNECNFVHAGNFAIYRHQDSGVLYVSDWTNGLYFVRASVGHVHRFGVGHAETVAGVDLIPRITLEAAPPRVGSGTVTNPGPDSQLTVTIRRLAPNRICKVEVYSEGRNSPVSYQGSSVFDLWLGGFYLKTYICGPTGNDGVATFTIDTLNPLGLTQPVAIPDQFRLFLQAFSYEDTGTQYLLKASSRGTWFGFASQQ